MVQCSRQVIDAVDGFFVGKRFLLHDRDPLFTETFRQTLAARCRDRAAPAQIAEFALVRRARSVEVLRTVSRVIALPWRSDARPPARSRSGTRDRFDARSGGERLPKRLGKQRVLIMEEEAFADQEPIDGISELTTALDDPGAVGLRGDPGDVDTARGELDHKQHHISASNPSGSTPPR